MASVMATEREVVGEYVERIRLEVGLKMVGLVLVCLEFLFGRALTSGQATSDQRRNQRASPLSASFSRLRSRLDLKITRSGRHVWTASLRSIDRVWRNRW